MANGLLGTALSILNPPNNQISGIVGSDDTDMNEIQNILAGLNAPEKQPGILEALMTAIPQAIAIAFAQDPAEALADQLRNRQVLQEREKERKERVKQLGAQLQIEDILSRGRERRAEAATIRAEKRKAATDIAAEFRADIRDVRKFNRESGFQEKMANVNLTHQRQLMGLRQFYDMENAKTQYTNNVELEKLRSSNNIFEQKIGAELQFTLPLIYSRYFSTKDASDLYNKIAKGEKLTAEENAKITKAYEGMRNEKYRQELSLAHARSAGTSQSPVAKAFEFAMNKSTTNVIGYDAQGQVHELQKNMLGEYVPVDPKVKITKYANQKETFQYFFDLYSKVNPEMAGFAGLFGNQTDLPDDKSKSLKIDELINKARGKGDSDADIAADLNNPQVQASFGFTPQLVQEGLTRNKVNPEQDNRTIMDSLTRFVTESGIRAKGAAVEEGTGISAKDLTGQSEEMKKAAAKAKAVKTINSLNKKLQKKMNELDKTPPKQGSMEYRSKLQHEIVDLSNRLEVAYQAHPELRPK